MKFIDLYDEDDIKEIVNDPEQIDIKSKYDQIMGKLKLEQK